MQLSHQVVGLIVAVAVEQKLDRTADDLEGRASPKSSIAFR